MELKFIIMGFIGILVYGAICYTAGLKHGKEEGHAEFDVASTVMAKIVAEGRATEEQPPPIPQPHNEEDE